MIILAYAIGILFLVLLGLVFYELLTAPEGWEDDEGFHLGRKD